MALIRVDGTGVGEYNASGGAIEAEDYFSASGCKVLDDKNGGFVVGNIKKNNYLIYPNIKGLKGKKQVGFKLANSGPVSIEIRNGSPAGELIGRYDLKSNNQQPGFRNFTCDLPEMSGHQGICLIFGGKGLNSFKLDSFLFK
jgi:hypothetical protein